MLPELSGAEARMRIAARIASEIENGSIVNLGIGIPQLIPDCLPHDVNLILQTENGAILASKADRTDDLRVIDAGGTPINVLPGGAFVSAEMSFAIMRGGHVDVTVLGALEVDETGSVANWNIPGKKVPGMGGAMDIITGAKKVYIAMRHFSGGRCKLVRKCSLPLTAISCADVVVTEYCVVRRIEGIMTLTEVFPGVSVEELIKKTEMRLAVAPELKI